MEDNLVATSMRVDGSLAAKNTERLAKKNESGRGGGIPVEFAIGRARGRTGTSGSFFYVG